MRSVLGVLFFFTCALTARAQVPGDTVESVTVMALREKQVQAYVDAHAATSIRLSKIGRWEKGICPAVTGLKPNLMTFVIKRLKAVAAQVGAPVNNSPYCRHNVEIVFSSKPQSVMDYIREDREAYLGTIDNSHQAQEMAKVTHPIQSWYATGTVDANGEVFGDQPKKGPPTCFDPPLCRVMITGDVAVSAGTHLGNGLRTGFQNVIVVADRDKLVNQEIGAIADYIAYLVLAEPRSLDKCTALPSILNLLAVNCSANSAELSSADMAYLTGIYHMRADLEVREQKHQIGYEMKQALGVSSK